MNTDQGFPEGYENFLALLNRGRQAIMRPPPRMNVPDWADTYRRLSSSVGAVGGPWQTHRVEVARGPMMAVTEPGVVDITAMSCTQLMKTELMLNTFGYFAHLDPAPILVLEPKDEMANAFSKERIAPMISSSPVLQELMGEKKTRSSEDTIGFKKFPGGFLVMASAGSPTNMAMRAIRVTLLDEVDKYESTKEGDPIALAEERTSTFVHSALHIRACSPTWEETSRIYASYLASDQRRPYVRCPHCDHEQTLEFFKHVQYEKVDGEGVASTGAIYCEACGCAWTEAQRVKIMTTKGAIRHLQTRVFVHCHDPEKGQDGRQDPREERLWEWDEEHQVGYALCKHCGEHGLDHSHAGFTASKLYSPFLTVPALVKKWLESKDNPENKQTFYNTQLGLPFRAEVSKEVSAHFLAARAEVYQDEVPEGGLILTAGIDVQGGGSANLGRLEVEVVAWGLHEESWSVAHEVIVGNPAEPEPWEELDKLLLQPWKHERGFPIRIMGACIDSGGHNTQDVYRYAKARTGRNVWAIKGSSDRAQWSPLWPPLERERQSKKFRTGFRPIMLGVNAGKEAIRQKFLIEEAGPGFAHFPTGRPEAYYQQMTSENLIVERKAGVLIRRWSLKKGLANEALDCRVYAYAALQGLYATRKLDLAKAALFFENYKPGREVEAEKAAPAAAPSVRRSSWMAES